MLRMAAFVTLTDDADVDAILERLAAMLDADPNVLTFSVGRCEDLTGPPPATYAMVLGFRDRDAYRRYAGGAPHAEFAASVRAHLTGWTAAHFVDDDAHL